MSRDESMSRRVQEFQAAKSRVERRALRETAKVQESPMEKKAALAAYGTEAGPKELILGEGEGGRTGLEVG